MQSNFDFDTEKLAAYLERHVPGFTGPLVAEKFSGGQSNPTFKITTATTICSASQVPGGAVEVRACR